MIRKIEFKAMGSQMMAALDSEDEEAELALGLVPSWFEKWEQSLSRFRSDSELSQLNRSGEKPFLASETLMSVLKLSLEIEMRSNGWVTPVVLNALETAGYTMDFNEFNHSTIQTNKEFSSSPDITEIMVDEGNNLIILPKGLRLDFGGVAKGWAAQQVILKLKKFGPALMDAGGDIMTSSAMMDGSPWPISVADPTDPDHDLEVLQLAGIGVATSGQDYRTWNVNGNRMHHLIDIRTGRPAKSDVLTATVLAPNVIEAEMAAKMVLLMGSDEGLNWLENQASFAGLVVKMDNMKIVSSKLSSFIWRTTCPIQ
jgi:thiamine biosynthesis lipoprotein